MADSKAFFIYPKFAELSDVQKALDQIRGYYEETKEKGLFLSAQECQSSSPSKGYGPKLTSKNSLSYNELSWFFDSKTFHLLTQEMTQLLGPDLDMFMARVLITLPTCDIPDYILEKILPVEGKLHGSLGTYIKPEFARANFFAYNPWHNDAIDFPESDCYLVNSLFPLTRRNNGQAPLSFVPMSQKLGKIPQPFIPTVRSKQFSVLHNDAIQTFPIETPDVQIQDMILWHAFVIHNVGLNTSLEPAISLRFNFCPSYRNNGVRDVGHIRPISRSWISNATEDYKNF